MATPKIIIREAVAFTMRLLLCLLPLLIAQSALCEEFCCPNKMLGGIVYNLVGAATDPARTEGEGCASNCIYTTKTEPGKTFCFANAPILSGQSSKCMAECTSRNISWCPDPFFSTCKNYTCVPPDETILTLGGQARWSGPSTPPPLINYQVDSLTCEQDIPHLPNTRSNYPGVVFLDDELIVCGGGPSSCIKLGKTDPDWKTIEPMPWQTTSFTFTKVGNRAVVIGGRNSTDLSINSTAVLFERGWTKGPDIPTARYGHCTVAINSVEVVIIGGRNSSTYLNTVERFNIDTGAATQLPNLDVNSGSEATCTFYEGTIFYHYRYSQLYSLDLSTNSTPWSTVYQLSYNHWSYSGDHLMIVTGRLTLLRGDYYSNREQGLFVYISPNESYTGNTTNPIAPGGYWEEGRSRIYRYQDAAVVVPCSFRPASP